MTVFKPAACTLSCWGSKFQDGEKECMQCRFKDSCREAMLARVVMPPPSRSLPVLNNRPLYPPPPPPPPMQTSNTIVPLPAKPFYAPPVHQLPVPTRPQTPSAPQTAQQTVQQATQYYQQSTGYSLPNPENPNPLTPMHRPGAPSPAYYFTQYPGESVGSRIIKNTILRALEAIMYELMQFFRHWTWPPARR